MLLIEELTDDREAAIGFLQAVLADYPTYKDPTALVSALRAVIERTWRNIGICQANYNGSTNALGSTFM